MAIVTMTRGIEPWIWRGRRNQNNILMTDVETPLDVTRLDWSIGVGTMPSEAEKVIVTDASPSVVITDLLKVVDVVSSCKLSAYKTYFGRLATEVRGRLSSLKHSQGRVIHELTLRHMIHQVGLSNEPHREYLADEGDGYILIPGVPRGLMLGLWAKLVPQEELDLWVATEEGPQRLGMKAVWDLCERPEILNVMGCLACPQRGNCAGSLLEEPLEVTYTANALKRVVSARHTWVPPLYAADRPSGKIDASDLSMKGALRKATKAKELSKLRTANRQFHDKNCAVCPLYRACGMRKTARGQLTGVTDYCQGKVEGDLRLDSSNYKEAFEVLLGSIDYCRGQDTAAKVLAKIVEWVERGAPPPGYVPHVTGKDGIIAVPRVLIDAADELDLYGGFDRVEYWYTWSHGVGHWFIDCTEDLVSAVPGYEKESDWVCVDYSRHLSPLSGTRNSLFSYVDAKVLAEIEEAPRSRSNRYKDLESKIALAAYFMAAFIAPVHTRTFGPFGSQKIRIPSGPAATQVFDYNSQKWVTKPPKIQHMGLQNFISVFEALRSGNATLDFYLAMKANKLKDILCE